MSSNLSFDVHLNAPFANAIDQVTEALKTQGFGVLSRIDVDQAFKEKLGIDFRHYTILGACNPQLANRALNQRPDVGLLLPCNVTVEEEQPDRCLVRIVDPNTMLSVGDMGEQLADIASEAAERLQKVATTLQTS